MNFKAYPVILISVALYLLLYWSRYIQGGWDIEINLFEHQRELLDKRINNLLPSPQAELFSGIILGQNKDLPVGLRLALRDTSTLHIVVASGQNLSMVAGFFLALSGLIKRRLAITLGFLAVVGYVLLTGAQVPILRAAIMFIFASVAQLVGREKETPWILIVTAGLMLLINPKWIIDLSFQLSFLATFGVIVIAPALLKYLNKFPLLGQDLAVTIGAQVMVTPIIVANFHQLSIVSIITNLLVLWTIPFIMIGGSVMLLAASVWDVLGQIMALGLNALLTYFIYIIQFFGSLPFAWEYIGELPWLFWAGYYFLVTATLIFLKRNT